MRLWWTLVFIFSMSLAKAQLYGIQWLLGFHESVLDFRNDTIINYPIQPLIGITLTNANICDENGNFLYFTNGVSIFDRNGDLLENGDSLSPCWYTDYYYEDGLNIQQGALFLPAPGDSNHYYLFHFSDDSLEGGRPSILYYSIIDRTGNGGLGSVIEKNHIFYDAGPLFHEGGMTACKHANGRDWWIVMGTANTNRYLTFLLTPNGISDTLIQYIGPVYDGPNDNMYSKFSTDGTKYATVAIEGYVSVMNFDRCSGQFSNPLAIYNNAAADPINDHFTGGVAVEFSPNARFVYVTNPNNLTQYDLQAADIQDSAIIYYNDTDGFGIDMIQLGPDGKLYGSTWNGGYYLLHTVNYPDEPGDSCGFVDTGFITITANTENLPNMVNYMLGPLVGSGCDTITDVRQLTQDVIQIRVQPNPADKYVYVEMPMQGDYELDLVNEVGQVIAKRQTPQVDIFDTENLAAGIYFVRAIDKQNSYSSVAQKVVVVH